MADKVGVHRVAALAKVSIGTVDRALHGRAGINPQTRDRVLLIARELGYEPNLAARALSKRRAANLRIGVCVPRELRFFYDQLWEGIYDEVRRSRDYGIDFVFRPLPELGAGEAEEIKRLVKSGVQGIILTPGRPDTTTPVINQAERAGVRVVCVSTDAPASQRSSIVCVEPRLSGQLAGELMARCLPPRSSVAVVTGMLATENHARKCEGFAASFARFCPGGRVAEVIEGHEEAAECGLKVEALLARLPQLAGIYVNTVNCLPVAEALEARDRAGRVKLITTDLFREMVPYFDRDTICASIYQRPYQQGRNAVAMLVDHLFQQTPLASASYLNPSLVLHSNLHLFRELRAHHSA